MVDALMGQAPLTTRNPRRAKARDDVQSLKRRVVGAARLDLDVVHIRGLGPTLVRARRVRGRNGAGDLVEHLKRDGFLASSVLERNVELAAPPHPIDAALLASAQRDLRVLAERPMLDLARENRRTLARYGSIDAEWVAERRARLAQLTRISEPALWTDSIVEIVRALRGAEEATAIARAFAALDAKPWERRAEAERRVLAIASGEGDAELARLAERLEAARDFPGRAKKRRTLDVLRQAIGWPLLPAELAGDDFLASASAAIAVMPLDRDEDLAERLALVALPFRVGDDGVPPLDGITSDAVLAYAGIDLTLAQACALSKHDFASSDRTKIGGFVAEGLELELVAAIVEKRLTDDLTELDDVRAARAFATWSLRLAEHGRQHGITYKLKPKLFESLPKNEDLAVLTLCLLDHSAAPGTDPLATLDATLGLFQRLPTKARGILGRLRGIEPGAGQRLDPVFAAWLDDDVALDRAAHVARLAGESAFSHAIREDFEHAARRERERAHLEALATRSVAQARRLESLRSEERTLASAPRARTLRRLRARTERLFPLAYQRELDATFRQILAEGWNIEAPVMTPAWRDAVRFWLLVDDNKFILERLLCLAAKTPGRSVVRSFLRNRKWIERNKDRFDVEAWLAPRRSELSVDDARFVVALEEDPLEILRMGIPFGTCLALEDGSNAASTVLNAIEASKRVIYVRNQAGSIVARKLIGITRASTLVGYRLYTSVGGEQERAIKSAVMKMCSEIARDVGIRLANSGTAEHIYHRDFWYDDGEVPFEPSVSALPAYCASLGLVVPPKADNSTLLDAERWHARETGDIAAAVKLLSGESVEQRMHDAWVIERLGLRGALRQARSEPNVAFALFEQLASSVDGVIRMLDVAGRLHERRSGHRIAPLLRRFPPSPKIAVALVDLALRSVRNKWASPRGHAHMVLDELPNQFEDVAGALDLVDSVEPAWQWLAGRIRECAKCVEDGLRRTVATIEECFERRPEPDVVAFALMSRRRSHIAHRAALRIAARHVLPNGRHALRRFTTLRPDLAVSADGLAAFLRQAEVEVVTPALARAAPIPSEPPYEGLRDLVTLPGIALALGRYAIPAVGPPMGPWEEAWRRRRDGAEPLVGRDAVDMERARRVYLRDHANEAARDLLLASPDGGLAYWVRLLDACARGGDRFMAERILETKLQKGGRLPPRLIVDLWSFEDEALRAAVAAKLARQRDDSWAARVWAAEREAAARGTSVAGLRERVAMQILEVGAPSLAVTSLTSLEQLRPVIETAIASAPPEHAAAVYAYLEDGLSVSVYRRALCAQSAERRESILVAIRKLERSSPQSKTFFAWLIGGIETA